jgi:Rps23 Pro-64 3,4-dihydroxylase Tpa1-like proline 4-hydroxylase
MFGFFNYKVLADMAEGRRIHYQMAYPFPHQVIDIAADSRMMDMVHDAFPKKEDVQWWNYDNALEKKLAFDRVHELPTPLKLLLCEMNSGPFIDFLEKLTGIRGLIPDPHFAGGGLHNIERGGKLDIHADFNWHKRMELHRRINVILYLNKDWESEYGGELELWDEKMQSVQVSVLPLFNRMVVFNTTDFSYHGHPNPLTCPEDMTRKSVALYYYSSSRPQTEISESHSTLYQRRPQDSADEATEVLRRQRAKGRVEDSKT